MKSERRARRRELDDSLGYAIQAERDPKIKAREAELRAQIAKHGTLDPADEITPARIWARLTERSPSDDAQTEPRHP